MKKWPESKASFGNRPMAAQTFFQQRHDLASDRVEFKMLRFNKLAVPGDFTDNVKDIRRPP
jgi:hypothetical protein